MVKKRILISPLNWGLGHATRCIPIIKALEANNFEPILASDGVALDLLKKEFPHLLALELPSYAIEYAKKLPLKSFNTDLMHGLAKQTAEQALSDLSTSIELDAPHISWYQLTIEPNTLFHSKPPQLPNDDVLWEIQDQGQRLLVKHGYEQYEISAFSKPGQQSKHNLNYWRFGDYLGIGCGAHGKITDLENSLITRTIKVKHPIGYMDLTRPYLYQASQVTRDDLAFEFFMNRFRLVEACPKDEFLFKTGNSISKNETDILKRNVDKGLLLDDGHSWQVSQMGRRYLNSLLADFV